MAITNTQKYKNSKFYTIVSPYRGIVLVILGICIGVYAILKMPPFPALLFPIAFVLIGVIEIIKSKKHAK
ncbi:hypothetical protein [Leuconostoc citreum]